MPELTGDVFSLNSDAQYEGEWRGVNFIRASTGVNISGTLEGSVDFCHGLNASVLAQASAEAHAALSMFVAAHAEASAYARAGANITVQFAPDLFDRFGLAVDAGAVAEAAVAGRVSIGLDIGQIAQLAVGRLPGDLAAKIFEAFLQELDIRAGVWGRAAFAAMASAHLEIYGTLADDDDAGFVIEFGAAAGLKAGTGWDFFAVAGLRDTRRFYGTCMQLITDHIVREARKELPGEYAPAILLVDFCLPIALHGAYELGQATDTTLLANTDITFEAFVRSVSDQMRGFILRQIVEISDRLLSQLVDEVIDLALGGYLDEQQRTALRSHVESLIGKLRDQRITLEELVPIITDVVNIATVAVPDQVTRWREPISLAWTAIGISHVLGSASLSARAEAIFLGFSAGVQASTARLISTCRRHLKLSMTSTAKSSMSIHQQSSSRMLSTI